MPGTGIGTGPEGASLERAAARSDLIRCAAVFAAVASAVTGANWFVHRAGITDEIGWSVVDALTGIAMGALAALSCLGRRDRNRLAQETRRRREAEATIAASEQRFRDFAEVSSDWFWGLDRDLRMSFLSEGVERRTGERAEDLIGKPLRKDGLLEVSDEAWAAHLADLAARRPVSDFRFARVDATGRLRHFSVSAKPVFDPDGTFAGYRGTGRDITDLVEARRFLRQVIDALPLVVAVRDRESRYLLANRGFAELCGVRPEEVVGKKAGAFFGAEAGERVRARDRLLLERGQALEPREVVLRGKSDGVPRTWLNQVVPIRNATGEIATILSVGTDITTQKETESALLWTQARLRESERRFRDFAETASDWFWEQDENLRFTFLSTGIQRLSTMTPECHYGKTRRETAPLDVSDEQWARHEADLAARRPFTDFRFARIDSSGRKRYMTVGGKPVFDEAGRFRGYRGTGRDVTELVEAEQRFRDFAETGAHVFWELDRDLRITYFSESVTAVTGDPPAAFLGRTVAEMARDNPAYAPLLSALETRRLFRDLPFRRQHRDGRTLHLMFGAKPVLGASGELLGYRGTTRDVTAQREAEAEAARLRQARDLAAAASLARSRFLGHMSHELRTPLNAILGFSDLMLAEPLGPIGAEGYRSYLKHIRESGYHLLAIVDRLLEISQIELGTLQLREQSVEVAAVVADAVDAAHRVQGDHGPPIAVEPIDAGWVVLADRQALHRVLASLLSNASKFTPREGTVRVDAASAQDGGFALRIADSGCGIERERLERIFEPFQNEESARARKGKGAGLGLWLSRALVELHGGSLDISSRPGAGTTATVTLPAARVLSRPPAAERDRPAGRRLAG
jgi:PAS domain S-box-containing protein